VDISYGIDSVRIEVTNKFDHSGFHDTYVLEHGWPCDAGLISCRLTKALKSFALLTGAPQEARRPDLRAVGVNSP